MDNGLNSEQHLDSMATASGGLSRLAIARLQSAGVPVAPLLMRVGLTPEVIADPEERLSVRSQITLLDEAATALKDDCLGFTMARAPRPFTTVVPGTADVVEVLRGSGRELVFMVKPEGGTTNILLLNDDGEQVANLLIINPSAPGIERNLHQGPDGWEMYRKDTDGDPNYVKPKEKK